MKKYSISICIPTFNRADLIDQTLQSVANQTVKPYEVLIIDNASTDNTAEIVARYKKYGFKYIRNKKNIGMAENYNRCIELAKGEYFTFLPSDDLISPIWYDEWQKVLKKVRSKFYTSPLTIVDNTLKPIWSIPIFNKDTFVKQPNVMKEFWSRYTPGVPPSAASVYHKSIFTEIPKFSSKERTECDVRVAMNLFSTFDVYYHHKFLFAFRAHAIRSFDKKKETRIQQTDLQKLEHYYQIVKDIFNKKFKQPNDSRFFIQTLVFMAICNINLYLAKLQFYRVYKTYQLTYTYFPNILFKIEDWIPFIKTQLHFVKRAIFMYRIPKTIHKQLVWLSRIKQ